MKEVIVKTDFVKGVMKIDNPPKITENVYKIIIQSKGKFEHYEIKRPMKEESFTFIYKDKEYNVKPEYVLPKDASVFTSFKNKILRRKINYEYYLFFKEGESEPIQYPKQEAISGSLLWIVMRNETTQGMLRTILESEGGAWLKGMNWKLIVMGIAMFIVGVIGLNYYVVHWW